MSISPVCAAPSTRVASRVTNVFITLLILFIPASIASAATLVVPAGGDLQAAIDGAAPGDTIVLDAGATYRGPFWLHPKSGDAYVTIQSSRAGEIAGRVTPAQSGLLAKLRSNVPADPIITVLPGAHHYKLIGLDISTFSATDFIYDLIRLGDGSSAQNSLDKVPHHLILDRLYVHGFPTQPVQRGISLNSAETSIINSYISDIHMNGIDTQAICGWNGPGPYQIINNYLEAAGENIMFGGADPSISGLIPSDIVIRRNHFFKPLSWKVGDPSYAGVKWTVKNLLETKNARRVTVDGNLFENNWADAQVGFAILLKSANQDNTAPWSVTEDLTFSNNIVRNVEHGLTILAVEVPPKVAAVANRIRVINNLWDVKKIWYQGSNGLQGLVFEHNTFLTRDGNTANFYGLVTTGFVFRNNLGVRAGYGMKGDGTGEGTPTLNVFCPGWIFEKNVVAGASASQYPQNNFYPGSLNDVGFVDLNGGNYRLNSSSPYRNAGTDGKDIGVDFVALDAAMNGSVPSPAPTPTPTPTPTPSPTPAPTPVPSPTPAPTGVIQFSTSAYGVNENAGSITITVMRIGSTAATATVQYSSSDATALTSSDYAAVAGTLTFAPGESSKSFTVFIIDDVGREGTEAFNVRLSNPSNASLGSPALASVNIADNDKRRAPRSSTTLLDAPLKKVFLKDVSLN